jgi:uncharacterized protein (UPF0332 family)
VKANRYGRQPERGSALAGAGTRDIESSRGLTAAGLYDDAVSRAYYAMFYAVNALLIRDGLNIGGKHSAVVAAFGREYARTGKVDPRYHQMLIQDFEWRQKADYDVYWNADEEAARKRAQDARDLIDLVTDLLT